MGKEEEDSEISHGGTKPEEFEAFVECLEEGGINTEELWFIPCCNDKSPDVSKGTKIKENEHIKLNLEEARERIQNNQNVGLYLRGLVALDVDDPEEAEKVLPDDITKTTLTTQSRSGKPHLYFEKGHGIEGFDYKDVVEFRTGWRYVLVPGSYAWDRKEYEGTGRKNWGHYEVVNKNPADTLDLMDLPEVLQKEITDTEDVEVNLEKNGEDFENEYGWKLEDLRDYDEKLDVLLSKLLPTEENHEGCNYPSRSEADMATMCKLVYWEFDDISIASIMRNYRNYEKTKRDDYIRTTLKKAKGAVEETVSDEKDVNTWTPEKTNSSEGVLELVKESLRNLDFSPKKIARSYDREEGTMNYFSVKDVLFEVTSVKEVLNKIRREYLGNNKNNIDKPERKRVIAEIVRKDMENKGRFLKGENSGKFYYRKKTKNVHRLEKIEPLLNEIYDIVGNTQYGNAAKNVLGNYTERNGDQVVVRKKYHYNKGEGELYIYDHDRHYFVLDGDGIEKRPNGVSGVYFRYDKPDKKIEYVSPENRNLDFPIAGEVDPSFEDGNKLHNYIANQTYFRETTNLSVSEQRLQLLLHFYLIPFGDLIPSKPIMVLTGEKGSTKSTTLRIFGKFHLGNDFEIRALPDEDDFYVAVSQYPLTFYDNVEDKPDWLEDALAVVATKIRVAKRKLYEDFVEAVRDPDTFLGMASRNVQYNRDDVMDRTLLFHVKRPPENNFVGEVSIFHPLEEKMNELWSIYLENLNEIVDEVNVTGLDSVQSNHRLADWASLASLSAEALGFDGQYDIDKIFEKMETERAAYTLRDNDVYQALKKARSVDTLPVDEWMSASTIASKLEEVDSNNRFRASTVGKNLRTHETEFREIFDMETEYRSDENHYVYKFGEGSWGEESSDKEDGGLNKLGNPNCEVCKEEMSVKKEAERKVRMNGEEKWLCTSCLQSAGYEVDDNARS